MIDHLFKAQMDRWWNRAASLFVRLGVTPNAVTLTSLCGVLLSSLALLWHRDLFWFAVSIGACELLDNLDGAIARVGNSATRAGAFLDATTDRVKEIAMFLAVAEVADAYLPSALALTGGLAASYNLARGQAEGARFRDVMPPLFERLERITILCVGAAAAAIVTGRVGLLVTLWILAVGNHITALQRLLQGFFELRKAP